MATMTVHATAESSVDFGEQFGLYGMLAGQAVSATDLARRSGLPVGRVSHWLAAQVAGDYIVREPATGLYRSWCAIG